MFADDKSVTVIEWDAELRGKMVTWCWGKIVFIEKPQQLVVRKIESQQGLSALPK